jgi:hypothetical protein
MSLTSEYLKNGDRNFVHGRSASERNARAERVCRFLRYCEAMGINRIRDIGQYHWDQFVEELHRCSNSGWTIYKYKLSVSEFAQRWRLQLRIRPDLERGRQKKSLRIRKILDGVDWLTPEQKQGLADLIGGKL